MDKGRDRDLAIPNRTSMKELLEQITEKLDLIYQKAFQSNELSTVQLIVEVDDLIDELKSKVIKQNELS